MITRVIPLLLALFVGGAPVVLQASESTCAASPMHTDHAVHAASGHPCHHLTGSTTETRIVAIPRACGHTGELPTSSSVSAQTSPSAPWAAVMPNLAPVSAPLDPIRRYRALAFPRREPGHFPSTTSLRL
jgi:hypothetical protein